MIRSMKNEDLDTVMDIWLHTSFAAHDFIEKSHWEASYEVVKKEYLPKAEVFVYEKDKQVLGFIAVMEKSYIGALFVKNEFRGQKIGASLLEFLKESRDFLTLSVYAENNSAVEFYKKHGFIIKKESKTECAGHNEYEMQWQKSF